MKIQKVCFTKPNYQTFKSTTQQENWDYDYGTYYNDITIKDAIISASILSCVIALAGMFVSNEQKVKEFIKKIVPSIKKEHINQII